MFLKGLLFGLGWVLGTGIAVTIILGVMALSEIVQKVVGALTPAERKPAEQTQPARSHEANLILVMRLPATAEERARLRERSVWRTVATTNEPR
jgi:hypothetical protein